ncbi:MAG: phospholipase D family protein, partial [Bacteroidetes bacterium]|nr:phospholipase D family protein [Bacteroidota bacterium]
MLKSSTNINTLVFCVFFFQSCIEKKNEQKMTINDFCSSIHRDDSTTLTKELEQVSTLMDSKTGVYVLEDGGGSMVARAWLSEYAEKTIDIQYFIFSTDNVGLIACDYIVRAADRGIKVRILVDDIMVEATGQELMTIDAYPNIEVKIYNPGVNIGKNIFDKIKKYATDFRSANQRMHNKTFTVDGKVCITGGRNIADEYFDYDHEYNFRDRDVLLLGKVVSNVQSSFDLFWNHKLSVDVKQLVLNKEERRIDTSIFNKLHQYACNPQNFWPQVRERIQNLPQAFKHINETGELVWLDSVYFVTDTPGKNNGMNDLRGGGVTTDSLIQLVCRAKKTIDISSPYLITTELGLKVFKEAVERGVVVRIMTNSMASTDNMEAFSGYQKCRKDLLKAGVKIYEFKPNAAVRYKIMTGALQSAIKFTPIFGLHAKSMVIDGNVTVIGTFNLDPRSANLNTECFAMIYSTKIANGVLAGMEEEFKSE